MAMIELTPDKKRLLILAGLSLGLVVVVGLRFLSPGTSSASAESRTSESILPKKAVGLLTADPEHLVRVARVARALSKAYYTGGDARDPMSPLVREATTPRAEPKTPGAGEEAIELPLMSLYGIIWDPKTPIAMIDGMDLRVGDRIKGARIIEIGIDRVVLSYRSKRFVLTVK
jgi:hypothetical protein